VVESDVSGFSRIKLIIRCKLHRKELISREDNAIVQCSANVEKDISSLCTSSRLG